MRYLATLLLILFIPGMFSTLTAQSTKPMDRVYGSDLISGVINNPNPFTKSTTIEYTLKNDAAVKVEVYNILGTPVRTYKVIVKAGQNSLLVERGALTAGMYFYKIYVGGTPLITRSMSIVD